jgi:hypothetical protein
MTNLGIITNLSGFEHALEDVKDNEPGIKEVRLTVSRKVMPSELGVTQAQSTLLVGCNAADKYLVGVAIMSVFGQVPVEHESAVRKHDREMLELVRRQTVAMEDLVKIVRAK